MQVRQQEVLVGRLLRADRRLNEATIAKYIREQEKADIALDRLSVEEYEDPFSRGPKKRG